MELPKGSCDAAEKEMMDMKNCHNNKYDNLIIHRIPQKQRTYLQVSNSCLTLFTKSTIRI